MRNGNKFKFSSCLPISELNNEKKINNNLFSELSTMHPTGSNESQPKLKLSPEDAKELNSLVTLLWGTTTANYATVFARWSQGFVFSKDEQSALVQNAGGESSFAILTIVKSFVLPGPCSVIASVQAYMLKHLIMALPASHQFNDLTEEKCKKILIQAICNILTNSKEHPTFRIVILDKSNDVEKALESPEEQTAHTSESREDEERMDTSMTHDGNEVTGAQYDDDALSSDRFHERLVVQDLETIEEVEKFYSQNFSVLTDRFGILLHLYSVLFTKGIENVLNEISDTSEPLIHSAFGYGSQSLINLMLTGRAVQHVFDNDQDIGGLKLKGIDRQSEIGFITLMEQLRYCTVGSFFKNPKHPIWVMGSETHLTVLFSNEKSLVSPETPAEHARRVFSQYDTENSSECTRRKKKTFKVSSNQCHFL